MKHLLLITLLLFGCCPVNHNVAMETKKIEEKQQPKTMKIYKKDGIIPVYEIRNGKIYRHNELSAIGEIKERRDQ